MKDLQSLARQGKGKWLSASPSSDFLAKRDQEIFKLELKLESKVVEPRDDILSLEDLSLSKEELSPEMTEILQNIEIFHKKIGDQVQEMGQQLEPMKEFSELYRDTIEIQHEALFQKELNVESAKTTIKSMIKKIE